MYFHVGKDKATHEILGFRRVAPMTGHENDGLIRIAYNIWCAPARASTQPTSVFIQFSLCIIIYIIMLPYATFFFTHNCMHLTLHRPFDLDQCLNNVGQSQKHVYQTVIIVSFLMFIAQY